MKPMTTTTSTTTARPAGEEHEELWNLLVLQSEAVRSRLSEFHQQVELYIQQTGEHPLTGHTNVAAAHDALPLRDRTTPAHAAPLPLVSDEFAKLTQGLRAPSGAVRDASAMAQLTKKLVDNESPLTIDDKAQVLFVLDASFRLAPTTVKILLSAFEKDGGYGVLMGWYEASCVVKDDASTKALTTLLLQFLDRHRPKLPFSRKTVVNRLRAAMKSAVGHKNRALLKDVVEKYQARDG